MTALMRARQASPEHGRVMARIYERAADQFHEEGRRKHARFMEQLSAVYAANALINAAARRAEEDAGAMRAAA